MCEVFVELHPVCSVVLPNLACNWLCSVGFAFECSKTRLWSLIFGEDFVGGELGVSGED